MPMPAKTIPVVLTINAVDTVAGAHVAFMYVNLRT